MIKGRYGMKSLILAAMIAYGSAFFATWLSHAKFSKVDGNTATETKEVVYTKGELLNMRQSYVSDRELFLAKVAEMDVKIAEIDAILALLE